MGHRLWIVPPQQQLRAAEANTGQLSPGRWEMFSAFIPQSIIVGALSRATERGKISTQGHRGAMQRKMGWTVPLAHTLMFALFLPGIAVIYRLLIFCFNLNRAQFPNDSLLVCSKTFNVFLKMYKSQGTSLHGFKKVSCVCDSCEILYRHQTKSCWINRRSSAAENRYCEPNVWRILSLAVVDNYTVHSLSSTEQTECSLSLSSASISR